MDDWSAEPELLTRRLRAAGCVYAEEEAALLRAEAGTADELEGLVSRRVAGEPLEQLLGWAEFCGLRIRVRPGVFVPRRRTELLVHLAAASVRPGAVLVDLCCGTAAVAAAVLHRLPGAEVHAADIDPVAIDCARLNLPTGHVHAGDLYEALPSGLRGAVDVLVVNAPYVPRAEIALMPAEARDHERRVALDGGADGLDLHRRVAAGAGDWLTGDGVLLLETSARLAEGTLAACVQAGLDAELVREDEAVAVRATRSSTPIRSGPSVLAE